jgi:N-acetylglucosaminyldiphosphoundecaprenol N-acetyl-beta-D-mannosaminyltransferase
VKIPTVRTTFLDCPIDLVGTDQILAQAQAAAEGAGPRLRIEGLNVAKLVEARENPALMAALRDAELVHADGMGIVFGLAATGLTAPRCAGIDVMRLLCGLAAQRGIGVYLLGARADIVAEAAERLVRDHPGLIIAGVRDGYFAPGEERQIAQEIEASGAGFLFIGMSSPRKEIFLQRHWDRVGAGVGMGVGGSFDVLSGRLPRAPVWMQRIGFEWLFRLLLEPRRLGWRYLRTNAIYAALLLGMKVRSWRRTAR